MSRKFLSILTITWPEDVGPVKVLHRKKRLILRVVGSRRRDNGDHFGVFDSWSGERKEFSKANQ